jgi:hypothetical protein
MLYSQNSMASQQTPTNVSRKPSANPPASSGFVYLPLIAGWLVPGAGHFLQGKWGRGALLAASVLGMFVTGLAMQGKLFASVHDILDLLGFVGDMGNGLVFIVGRIVGLGADQEQITMQEWGTRFIEVAGLLNVIAAVDAHNIRTGRKAS